MKYIIILSILILSACKKEGYEQVSNYQGDYDLAYIKVSDLKYMTPEEVNEKVGVRVLDNGNIKTYINGDFHRKYKLQGSGVGSNDTIRSVYQWESNKAITVKLFENNKIMFPTFPFEGEQNYFHKK